MKFLLIGKLKDAALMMPPATLLQMFEATAAGMKQHQKEGKLLDYYHSPANDKIIVILNYDNADQWAAEQGQIPLLPYLDYEAYPLADGFKYLQGLIENMRKALPK